jgi:hypothetical protein
MVIQYVFVAPSTTDPRSAPIILMVKHLQQALGNMGANVPISGYLDTPTAQALDQVVGPDWQQLSWADNIRAVVDGRSVGFSAAPPAAVALPPPTSPAAVGAFDFLPDVPGGFLTYLIGGLVAYHYLAKRR